MSKKSLGRPTRIAAGLAATTLAVGSVLWITFGNGVKLPVPAYKVTQVIDGDTFYASPGLRVRLSDLDAPELDRCGGKEAKKHLEKLILNKTVYIKTEGIDRFYRNLGQVYSSKGSVNLEMLNDGMAVYRPDKHGNRDFSKATSLAKDKKKGIFGTCVQETNLKNPKCVIKGNINKHADGYVKNYFLPSCKNYKLTVVELYKGDQWFCTESEAKKAGFNKPKQCY